MKIVRIQQRSIHVGAATYFTCEKWTVDAAGLSVVVDVSIKHLRLATGSVDALYF